MERPEYISELKKVFEDTQYKRKLAEKVINKRYEYMPVRGVNYFVVREKYREDFRLIDSRWVETIFGQFRESFKNYIEEPRFRYSQTSVKNGVEVLGLRPNAKGNTWSYACELTVENLKEACKENNIRVKPKMKKTELIALLMKI